MTRRDATLITAVSLFFLTTACDGGGSNASSGSQDHTTFMNPQLVTINGYSGDAMEPFISRDGQYLFFNSDSGGATDKDIYYATYVTATTFQYHGPITSINSTVVDGVPTLDGSNKFYYVSLANYNGTSNLNTLYSGQWNGSTVTGSAPLSSLTLASPLLFFDIEVNPADTALYLSVGAFPGPSAADIYIAVKSGGSFSIDPVSSSIMANVNTSDKLEYAPAISADGLELFFTRMDPGSGDTGIYRAVRSSASAAFGAPQLVSAITGFAEAPVFSPDEKSLYYHRKNPVTNRCEILRVTRQ